MPSRGLPLKDRGQCYVPLVSRNKSGRCESGCLCLSMLIAVDLALITFGGCSAGITTSVKAPRVAPVQSVSSPQLTAVQIDLPKSPSPYSHPITTKATFAGAWNQPKKRRAEGPGNGRSWRSRAIIIKPSTLLTFHDILKRRSIGCWIRWRPGGKSHLIPRRRCECCGSLNLTW